MKPFVDLTFSKKNGQKQHHNCLQHLNLSLLKQPINLHFQIESGDGYANLRSQPSTEVGVVAKRIPNGTSVKILEERTNSSEQIWYRVQVNDEVGWVYSGLLN